MKPALLFIVAIFFTPFAPLFAAEPVIVENGQPRARIVIAAENRPRMATLAALELRTHIELMSGARLPIVTTPDPAGGVKIFVGRSPETDKLGGTADGLKFGAYRVVTGPDWIVLLGADYDFDPVRYRLPISRNDMERDPGWKSLAEVSTERGADFWRVRLRIPVIGEKDFESDPLHRVAGAKPTAENPWYFNVGRVRLAGEEREVQIFSPTGAGWHVPAKFGKLVIE